MEPVAAGVWFYDGAPGRNRKQCRRLFEPLSSSLDQWSAGPGLDKRKNRAPATYFSILWGAADPLRATEEEKEIWNDVEVLRLFQTATGSAPKHRIVITDVFEATAGCGTIYSSC